MSYDLNDIRLLEVMLRIEECRVHYCKLLKQDLIFLRELLSRDVASVYTLDELNHLDSISIRAKRGEYINTTSISVVRSFLNLLF